MSVAPLRRDKPYDSIPDIFRRELELPTANVVRWGEDHAKSPAVPTSPLDRWGQRPARCDTPSAPYNAAHQRQGKVARILRKQNA
jgi:hypothetical protein